VPSYVHAALYLFNICMLSQKAKYAIKALILLGKNLNNKFMHVSEIAALENISAKYLGPILTDLKIAGYVYSKKGYAGGYALRMPPEKITLDKIVRRMDGPIARILCASIFHYHKCEECDEEAVCSIRDLFSQIREADFKILAGTSVADMIKKENLLADSLLLQKEEE
jgi:Rrf2 family protein